MTEHAIFVTDTTDGWAPFTVGGRTVGEATILHRGESGIVAFWRVTDGPGDFEIETATRTTVYVQSGAVVVAVDGTEERTLGAGDVLVLLPGAKSSWRVRDRPYRELFVVG